jgi:hypothetical protein
VRQEINSLTAVIGMSAKKKEETCGLKWNSGSDFWGRPQRATLQGLSGVGRGRAAALGDCAGRLYVGEEVSPLVKALHVFPLILMASDLYLGNSFPRWHHFRLYPSVETRFFIRPVVTYYYS